MGTVHVGARRIGEISALSRGTLGQTARKINFQRPGSLGRSLGRRPKDVRSSRTVFPVPTEPDVWWRSLAAELLDLPEFRTSRWRHVQAVGHKAELLAPALGCDGETLVAVAWLHDIGYSPAVVRCGFHPIDGADELLRRGVSERLAALVANHSGAALEAPMRGLADDMSRFRDEKGPIRDALWTCDMTTSPVGAPVDFEERLREIKERYGPGHTVPRAIEAAGDEIRACIRRTRERARAAGIEADF